MSKIEVDTIEPQSGTTVTLGASGDTITVPSGTTLNVSSATLSGITQGITEADQWRITTNYNKTGAGTAILTSNWERNDNGFSLIGTGMTESSGIFSFPTTGIYMIIGQAVMVADGGTRAYMSLNIQKTTDNSTYDTISYSSQNAFASSAYGSPCCTGIFDVTNISTHKIRMQINVESSVIVEGNTNAQSTGITVIRLGDT